MYYIKQLPHNTHIASNFIFFQTLSLKKLITISKLYNLKFFCLFSSFLYQQFPDSFAKISFFCWNWFFMWNHLFSLGGFASQIYVARSDVSRKALKMSYVKKGNIFLPYFWNFVFFSPIVILQFALQYFQTLISWDKYIFVREWNIKGLVLVTIRKFSDFAKSN